MKTKKLHCHTKENSTITTFKGFLIFNNSLFKVLLSDSKPKNKYSILIQNNKSLICTDDEDNYHYVYLYTYRKPLCELLLV